MFQKDNLKMVCIVWLLLGYIVICLFKNQLCLWKTFLLDGEGKGSKDLKMYLLFTFGHLVTLFESQFLDPVYFSLGRRYPFSLSKAQ